MLASRRKKENMAKTTRSAIRNSQDRGHGVVHIATRGDARRAE